MPIVDLDDDVYLYLLRSTVRFDETPSSVLRRKLQISGHGDAQLVNRAYTDTAHPLLRTVNGAEYRRLRNVTQKYLALLAALYQLDPDGFEREVLEYRGRKRVYFGRAEQEIESSGQATHPQPIPGTPFWAMTNASTEVKQDILRAVLTRLDHGGVVEVVCGSLAGRLE